MSTKKVELSGAAADVIHALFFRGALQDGDLPSKAGTSELRELGFAETRHTATKFKEGDYFTFLTPSGAEYARQFLVETRFGTAKVHSLNYNFGIQLRTPEEVREIEEYLKRQRLAKSMRDALEEISPFTVSNGQVFIQEAFFKGGEIQATKIEPVVEDKAKQESTSSEPKNNISINIHSVAPDSGAASDSISKAINLMLKPGGSIWRAMNKG